MSIYISNKYRRKYFQLMARSFNRPKPKKYEKHHIIPKSFGGNEEKWNTAYLTLREHFIAHLLLVKITIGNNKFKMLNALMRMSNSKDNKYNLKSRHYEKIRKDFSKEKSKSMMGSGNPNWGKTPTKEHIEKNRAAQIGKKKSKEHTLKKLKPYRITNIKTGITIVASDLNRWCKDNKINRSGFYKATDRGTPYNETYMVNRILPKRPHTRY
jgi:hypothetical protein